MEVNPSGTMLFIENKDVPGVIGDVGTFLGRQDINIAAYILSRKSDNGNAFAVIRVDNKLSDEQIIEYFVSNFIQGRKYIGDFDGRVWQQHKKIVQSIEYNFEYDIVIKSPSFGSSPIIPSPKYISNNPSSFS